MVPGAFAADASGLQKLIDDAGNVVTLQQNYVITDTVTINKPLTINGNGHTMTYNGGGSAVKITVEAPVRFNNLKIDAKANGAYAIDLTSKQPDLYLDSCVISVDTRGVNMYPTGGCTGGKLTLDKTTIQNSDVTGSYADNTTVGDTRGIALFDVKNSTITLTDSHIYGFGYSINTSAPQGGDGTRPASNTFDITNTDIWGWAAVNIWTVGNEFNFTNCDLRGINPLNILGNSFSVLNITRGIYGTNPETAAPNVFNITGGKMDAKMTVNTTMVEETLMTLEEELVTEYHFYKYVSGRNKYPVALTCDKNFAAIVYHTETGLDPNNALQTWIDSEKFSGSENTTYNQVFLVGDVPAGESKAMFSNVVDSLTTDSAYHAGGAEA